MKWSTFQDTAVNEKLFLILNDLYHQGAPIKALAVNLPPLANGDQPIIDWFGFPVRIDPTVPDTEMYVEGNGEIIRIINIGDV